MQRTDYLENILRQKKREIERLIVESEAMPDLPEAHDKAHHFSRAIKQSRMTVIAEIKRRSPSLGEIRQFSDPVKLALDYCEGGASAISVLTDESGFGGSLQDLKEVATELNKRYPHVAVIRKDFIIHPVQLAETVSAGAHAVLLIAKVVRKELAFLLEEAHRLGLEVLTEVHDLDDLALALEAKAPIIGINHRNLGTFTLDMSLSKTLRPLIPSHVIAVAESGIHEPDQARSMSDLGYDAILVGEALVRAQDPTSLIQQMRGKFTR